jgi:hypothetical protein
MSIVKKKENENLLENFINSIKNDEGLLEQKKDKIDEGIVDVITFCNSAHLMDLPGQNFPLFLSQRVILKTFYMGTRGNENVTLNDEEWKWLYDKQQNPAIIRLKRKVDGQTDGKSNFNFKNNGMG